MDPDSASNAVHISHALIQDSSSSVFFFCCHIFEQLVRFFYCSVYRNSSAAEAQNKGIPNKVKSHTKGIFVFTLH